MLFRFGELVIDSEKETWRSEGIRIGFYSAPGTRKSYTVAACIVEPFLAEGGTVVIFEPRSEWHTLKQRFESIVVVGGPFQDVPLAVNQARVYAEAIVQNGVSIVFDFSETDERDLVKFSAELLQRIYTLQNVTRRPLLLFPEEISEYAPFRTTGKLVEPWVYDRMKSRIVKIATQGRPLGFNMVFTSQRPAQVDFTVRMMANLSFYGKFHSKDLSDIKEVLSTYKNVPAKEMAEKCVNMPHGTWIAITAEEATFTTIDAKRLTPHGADTPKLEYVAPRTEETKRTLTNLAKTITEALEHERLEESELKRLKKQVVDITRELNQKTIEIERLKQTAETLGKIKIETPSPKVEDVTFIDKVRSDAIRELKEKVLSIFDAYLPTHPLLSAKPTEDIYTIWDRKMPSPCARKVFKFLLDNTGAKFTKSELGVKTGYSPNSGGFKNTISFLKRNNLINYDGKFVWCD